MNRIGRIADSAGVQTYAVGGFVRDALLGHTVKDIDFVVLGDGPAFAKMVSKELKANRLTIYKKFGTALVEHDGYQMEFVGSRAESYREGSRKPEVRPADLKTDLTRRDFTINALALSLNSGSFGEIIDLFNGRRDLEKGVLRTPLEPLVTFSDDPLRIMRAVRFATTLNFGIAPEAKRAIQRTAERLTIISQERITEELLKILAAKRPSIGFFLMADTGILEVIFPELIQLKGVEAIDGHHHKDVFFHTLKVLDNLAAVSDDKNLRFAALVHDIAKPRTKQLIPEKGWSFHNHEEVGARMLAPIGRRLRLPNEMVRYAQKLTRLHLRPIALTEESVTDSAYRRLLLQAGDDLEDLLTLCRADITSQNPRRVKKHLANFDFVVKRLHEVEEKDKMRAFQSPVRGDEIMQVCDLRPGPQVGKLKSMIEEAILEGEIPNDHEAALEYLLNIKSSVLAD